jgi:hypothetical protein
MKSKTQQKFGTRHKAALQAFGLCLGGAVATVGTNLHGQDQSSVERLAKENQELRKRLDALETAAKKEGTVASGTTSPLKALSETTLSGFVSASYMYDSSSPTDGVSNGYLWSRDHNSITLNKVKVTLERPIETSGDKWDGGYRASLIWGQDSQFVNTGGELQGLENIREAFVNLNVPVGTGLNVKAGQLISLLNFESGDGGAANPNFSQGNQWFFTGNGPSTGLQLGYALSEMVDVKVRVQNGMFTGVKDNNGFKTLMGSVGIKPDAKTSISLIGFGGREGADNELWLKGGSVIASRELVETCHLNVATELDYFNLDQPGGSAEWWSIGGWVWADFTPKVGLALRGDYLSDGDGAGTGGLLGFPNHTGMDLYSLTLTLNLRPVPNLKIQPEIRFEHTSLDGGFDGENDRVIAGVGVSYLF